MQYLVSSYVAPVLWFIDKSFTIFWILYLLVLLSYFSDWALNGSNKYSLRNKVWVSEQKQFSFIIAADEYVFYVRSAATIKMWHTDQESYLNHHCITIAKCWSKSVSIAFVWQVQGDTGPSGSALCPLTLGFGDGRIDVEMRWGWWVKEEVSSRRYPLWNLIG